MHDKPTSILETIARWHGLHLPAESAESLEQESVMFSEAIRRAGTDCAFEDEPSRFAAALAAAAPGGTRR